MYTITDIKLFSPVIVYASIVRYRSPVSGRTVTTRLPSPRRLATLSDGEYVCAGRDADQQAFFAAEPPRHLDRFVVGDRDDLVVDLAVQDAGHEAGADALDRVDAGAAALEHRRTGRLHGDDQ